MFDVIPDNVRLIGNLDFELATRHYPIDVRVTDGLHDVIVSGSINVLPENEFDPAFRNIGIVYIYTWKLLVFILKLDHWISLFQDTSQVI